MVIFTRKVHRKLGGNFNFLVLTDREATNIVYKSLQKDREQADITNIIQQLHKVVDEAIETNADRLVEEHEPYDISKIDFDRRNSVEKYTKS